jgi:hypothetical protein
LTQFSAFSGALEKTLESCVSIYFKTNLNTIFISNKFLDNSLIPAETLRLIEQSAQNDIELQGGYDGYDKCSKISKTNEHYLPLKINDNSLQKILMHA